MGVTYNEAGGYYSNLTGQTYTSADDAHMAESSLYGMAEDSPGYQVSGQQSTQTTYSPTADQTAQANAEASANDQNAKWDPVRGTYTMVPMSPVEADANRLKRAMNPATAPAAPSNPNPSAADIVQQTRDQLGIGSGSTPTPVPAGRTSATNQFGAVPTRSAPVPHGVSPIGGFTGATPQALTDLNQANAPGPATSTPPPAAPTVDTTKSDAAVAGVNNTISQLLALANQSPQTSAAEAQLHKADQLAKLRAIDELRNNQAASLGAARSSRDRSAAGVLERAAVGESAYLGTKAQNQDVLRQAELEGNLATQRATEEQTDFTNRAAILGKAADLGLNVAALDVDVGKADLASASNYLDEQFQQLGLDKQLGMQKLGLDQQQMANVLSFTQAMSAIQFDYDKMSNDDQQHTLDLMMQQYGIDKNAASALAQIKESRKMNWGQLLTGMVGGAAQGGILLAGKAAGIK